MKIWPLTTTDHPPSPFAPSSVPVAATGDRREEEEGGMACYGGEFRVIFVNENNLQITLEVKRSWSGRVMYSIRINRYPVQRRRRESVKRYIIQMNS